MFSNNIPVYNYAEDLPGTKMFTTREGGSFFLVHGVKLLLMVQKSQTTTWDGAKTFKKIMGHLPCYNW